MTFWKVNHEPRFNNGIIFNKDDWQMLLNKKLLVVGSIINIQPQDYFYLTHGNKSFGGQGIQLLGKIVGKPESCTMSKWSGWQQCNYEIIKETVRGDRIYREDYKKGWTPNYQSSIFKVPESEETFFEEYILRPFFNMKIDPTTHEPIDVEENISSSTEQERIFPLNQIFFGSPGTGKTYSTISYAVAICNNKKLNELSNYAEIKREYDRLQDDGRINFVTFHQSYGYEDFIEGIKPVIDERGNISYQVKAGVFKKFCEHAKNFPRTNFVFIIDEIIIIKTLQQYQSTGRILNIKSC